MLCVEESYERAFVFMYHIGYSKTKSPFFKSAVTQDYFKPQATTNSYTDGECLNAEQVCLHLHFGDKFKYHYSHPKIS
jgi:hypothetical protein